MTASPQPRPLPVELVPRIIYSPLARQARVHGTGLEVWEIIHVYRLVGEDFDRLQQLFDRLTTEQLQAALTFAGRNTAFIAAELAEADNAPQRLKALWRDYPFTMPPHRR